MPKPAHIISPIHIANDERPCQALKYDHLRTYRETAAFKTNHLAQNEKDSVKNGRLSRAVSAENNRQWGRRQAPFTLRR